MSLKNDLTRAQKLADSKQQEIEKLSQQVSEVHQLRQEVAQFDQLYQKSRVDHVDLQQTRSENETFRKEIHRLNTLVSAYSKAEEESNTLANRENSILREEL